MLSVLLIWFYIFILFFVFGWMTFCAYQWITKGSNKNQSQSNSSVNTPPIAVLLLLGYCTVTALLQVYSLFSGIALGANIVLVVFAMLFSAFTIPQLKKYFSFQFTVLKKVPVYVYAISLIYVIITLLMIIKSDFDDNDTGFYHAQVIQWSEKFAVVKGIANLFPNYAFNNSSLLMSALFSFTFLKNFPFHVLNGFLVLAFVISATFLIFRKCENKISFTFLYAGISALVFFYLRGKMSLPYPDVTVTVVLLSAFFIFLLMHEDKIESQFQFLQFVFVVSIVVAITIKLTATMMLMFVGYLFYVNRKSLTRSKFILSISACSLIALPWLFRNYIQSGYLIFPYYQIDLFDVFWKLPVQQAKVAMAWISGYAKTKEITDSFDMSLFQWLPVWWSKQDFLEKIFLIWIAVTPFIMLVIQRFSRNKSSQKSQIRLMISTWSICFIALISWFFSAPDFRFGMAYIFICSLIPLQLFLLNNERFYELSYAALKIFTVVTICYFALWPIKLMRQKEITFSQHWLLPEPKYKPIESKSVVLNGIQLSVPVGNKRCWNEPLPCTCLLDSNIQLIGKVIQDGFEISSK